jgi:hypothetical protein
MHETHTRKGKTEMARKRKTRRLDSQATVRRKIERRALPPESPPELLQGWRQVVMLAMLGWPEHEVARARQIMRQAEKDWLKQQEQQ